MRINLIFSAVHTEHCYVQYPFATVEDKGNHVHQKLMKVLKDEGISCYGNHLVIECLAPNLKSKVYLGWNDCQICLGFDINSMDSKKIMLSSGIITTLIA